MGRLQGLLPALSGGPTLRALKAALDSGVEGPYRRVAVLEAAKPALVAALAQATGAPVLVVTTTAQRAAQLQEEIEAWTPSDQAVSLYPDPAGLPYERVPSAPGDRWQRLAALHLLAHSEPGPAAPIVLAPTLALMQHVLTPVEFKSAAHTITVGQRVRLDALLQRWVALGYRNEALVEEPGAFSRRGGVVDIWPPQSPLPVRLELDADRVDSLRQFDPASQRSSAALDAVAIIPAREALFPADLPQRPAALLGALGLDSAPAEVQRHLAEEAQAALSLQRPDLTELYGAVLNKGGLLDFLPSHGLLVVDELAEVLALAAELEGQARELGLDQQDRGLLPPGFPVPYWGREAVEERLAGPPRRVALERWGQAVPLLGAEARDALPGSPAAPTARRDYFVLPCRGVPAFGGRQAPLAAWARSETRAGGRAVIVSQQAPRLAELLRDEDLFATPVEALSSLPSPGTLTLVHGGLAQGFGLLAEEGGLALSLVGDAEVFGFVKQRRRRPPRTATPRVDLGELAPGAFIVHADHGIARFAGVQTVAREGAEQEYLVLEYAGGDRLFVPADQISRVTAYIGHAGQEPRLHRLGGQEWGRARERAQRAASMLAEELLELYASRQVLQGQVCPPDTVWQQELEASFPYAETPDQLQAIEAVKADMESPRPMDRLVCGDVGYGKTEVAVRAAFKALMSGRQVAVLVPTTVLAQQHLQTFSERLAPFPIRLDVLSRFRSDREQGQVVQGLREGTVDLVIGTHRLLQKDVAFKDLGLVIIDEEQRFGVGHKERLKQMRREVDVLTLSATPIPRTLHMALAGVRDLSTMETPPEHRLPILTYVAEYDEKLVREAMLRELERGGQVFYLHNRVQTIARAARRLQELVPEARIAVGHGQMHEEALERVMLEFAQGQHDVLVCTTIIESGLDLPNVNTLLVERAEQFGLAQLYQLRGRVGRGPQRAYAYFLFERDRSMTETAQKRLDAIFQATELGAGLKIALKDLEIRGAGNLLGPEQSGYISAVGFDLYTRLLADAVARLQDQQAIAQGRQPQARPRPPEVTVDLPLAAHLPADYVSDVNVRMELYRRLGAMTDQEETAGLEQELRDRFGALPGPARALLDLMRLKLRADQAGVESIQSGEPYLTLKLRPTTVPPTLALERAFGPAVRVLPGKVLVSAQDGWYRRLRQVLDTLAGPAGARSVANQRRDG